MNDTNLLSALALCVGIPLFLGLATLARRLAPSRAPSRGVLAALAVVGVGLGATGCGAALRTALAGSEKSVGTIVALCISVAVAIGLVVVVDRSLPERMRPALRWIAAGAALATLFVGIDAAVPDHARAVDVAKAAVALIAAGCVYYEAHRIATRRPVAERWKKFVGLSLGVVAIALYFNAFRFGYPKYYHRWDQYHYYMGAKYFREIGYSGLYKCSLVAQDELGLVTYEENGRTFKLDLSKEARHPDKKIRNLSGDNLLKPAVEVLDESTADCKARFSPSRWEKYKEDVKFFRLQSDKGYWEDMQKDHGYNPPPVWTIAGNLLGNLHPASVNYMQFLASLDIFYLAGVFVALYWGFGWRVAAAGAIFWGCQSPAPFYWTGGAFLRQDWLFFLVLSAALVRRKYFKLAGASMVYAGLLRIFPGLAVIGWLTIAGAYVVRTTRAELLAKKAYSAGAMAAQLLNPVAVYRRMHGTHKQALLGGTLAAAILIPASLAVSGVTSYNQFVKHTLVVHDQTPLTNHMGLRVLVSHDFIDWQAKWPPVKISEGKESGRMKFTKDMRLVDPFQTWKDMRNDAAKKYRWASALVVIATFAFFAWVLRRIRSLWVGQCLGQIWIILLSQLTCYYYSFMILSAPLIKLRPRIEAPLYGLAALSQFVWMGFYWNDDKYTALTLISLVFCYYLLFVFVPQRVCERARARFFPSRSPSPAAPRAEPRPSKA